MIFSFGNSFFHGKFRKINTKNLVISRISFLQASLKRRHFKNQCFFFGNWFFQEKSSKIRYFKNLFFGGFLKRREICYYKNFFFGSLYRVRDSENQRCVPGKFVFPRKFSKIKSRNPLLQKFGFLEISLKLRHSEKQRFFPGNSISTENFGKFSVEICYFKKNF